MKNVSNPYFLQKVHGEVDKSKKPEKKGRKKSKAKKAASKEFFEKKERKEKNLVQKMNRQMSDWIRER